MNPKVDQYLIDGCGRCAFYQTPQCKVHTWHKELVQLRRIVMDCGLEEDYKWKQPCYTLQDKNIVLVTAFKDYAALAFFKGSLLKDPEGILVAPGESSQYVKQARFTKVEEIIRLEPVLKSYIYEAIEAEKDGLKVETKKNPEPLPDELIQKMGENPEFKVAFEALTPGRQRGYLLFFSQPKQTQTRVSRIEKMMPKIFEGKGMNDR